MGEDIDRIQKIHQRIQAVAGGVLHAELVPNALGKLFVIARGAGERIERVHEFVLLIQKRRSTRCIARVEHRAVGKNNA